MGKNAGVPEKAKTIMATADMSSAKVGSATALKSEVNGTVSGPVAGWPRTPTAMVRVKTAECVSLARGRHHRDLAESSLLETRIKPAPPAASQLTLDRVGIEVRPNAITAPTATYAAVQVA